jgi:colanic acid biosynthesis glycosyl transferase WcaI
MAFYRNKKMKIELWSSVEYSGFGRALVKCLAARGASASLEYEISQKEYWRVRGMGSRLAFRLRSYGLYPIKLVWRLICPRDESIAVVSTNTFYAPFLATLVKRRGAGVVHWVLDLYPDVLVLHGVIKENGWVSNLISRLIKSVMRRSSANVFLGHHLLAYAQSRFGPIRNAFVIPVGADGGPFRATSPSRRTGPVRILYAGNLGRMHDIETIEGAIKFGLPSGVCLVFRASGAGYRELRNNLGISDCEGPAEHVRKAVYFGDNLGEDGWCNEMLLADVALVTIRRGAEGIIMPSKAYSAMVSGQAILAIAPRSSDLAELVQKYDCGWLVEPGDTGGLISALNQIVASRDLVFQKRMASFRAGHSYFDQSVLAGDWMKLIKDIEKV